MKNRFACPRDTTRTRSPYLNVNGMEDPFLNYFALGLLFFVVIVLVYGIIAIHDIPARIAHARHHPHEDAIHAAGWISLFMLHCAVAVPLDLGDDVSAGPGLGFRSQAGRAYLAKGGGGRTGRAEASHGGGRGAARNRRSKS